MKPTPETRLKWFEEYYCLHGTSADSRGLSMNFTFTGSIHQLPRMARTVDDYLASPNLRLTDGAPRYLPHDCILYSHPGHKETLAVWGDAEHVHVRSV